MSRHILGILGLLLFFPGVLLYLCYPSIDPQQFYLGAMVRIGAVLCTLWLAHPQLSRIPGWMYQAVAASALVVAIRPKLIALVLPALLALWILKPRIKTPGPKGIPAKPPARERRHKP